MVTCDVDHDIAGEVLGWRIPAWQSLILHRVLPSCGGLIVYLTLMCFDFALIIEHYQNNDNGKAAFCIILITLPALVSTVFTLASPPPGLQPDLTAYSVNINKKDLKWIAVQTANLVLFPFAAIGRYCHLIFWWIEAVCASRDEDNARTREAIRKAKTPSSMELYLFLQAFLHCAPNAIVNILDLIARFHEPAFGTATMQAVSIVVSCMRMSSTATVYRRFEREKVSGKKFPWDGKHKLPKVDDKKEESIKSEEPIYESIRRNQNYFQEAEETNSDLIEFSPRSTMQNTFYDDNIYTDSDSSLNYLPPRTYRDQSTVPPESDSDNEYVRPLSIVNRVAPRRSTTYTIERVEIAPPPVIPAPRPGSLAVWAEKFVENAEAIPTWLSAPPRRKYHTEIIPEEPDLPRYVPTLRIRGLEPQDATAALVHYLGWYAFFISRLLSIAAFINFNVMGAVIILFSHYQIMLLLLIVPQASTLKRGFYIFLAFVYLFCLMEFKIRFRHVRVWHICWVLAVTVETVVFAGVWVGINNDIHDWWKTFIVAVIFGNLLLSYMCFIVYFVLLQPRETVIILDKK